MIYICNRYRNTIDSTVEHTQIMLAQALKRWLVTGRSYFKHKSFIVVIRVINTQYTH